MKNHSDPPSKSITVTSEIGTTLQNHGGRPFDFLVHISVTQATIPFYYLICYRHYFKKYRICTKKYHDKIYRLLYKQNVG